MARKAKENKKDNSDNAGDSPLLDSANIDVKKIISLGKERGFVTFDELNAAMPHGQVSSEQIDEVMSMLQDAGISVENEDGESSERDEEKANKLIDEVDDMEFREMAKKLLVKIKKAEDR